MVLQKRKPNFLWCWGRHWLTKHNWIFAHKEPSFPLIFTAEIFPGKTKGLAQRLLENLKFAQNTNAGLLASPLGSAAWLGCSNVCMKLLWNQEVCPEHSLSRFPGFPSVIPPAAWRSCNFSFSWVVCPAAELFLLKTSHSPPLGCCLIGSPPCDSCTASCQSSETQSTVQAALNADFLFVPQALACDFLTFLSHRVTATWLNSGTDCLGWHILSTTSDKLFAWPLGEWSHRV